MIELGMGGGTSSSAALDTSDAAFMTDVIEASMTQPVVALFWSPADPGSVSLSRELEREVGATGGAAKLVRLDVDKNMMVAEQLRLQAVPAVLAFHQRQGLDGFQGMAPPQQIKEFMKRVLEAAGAPGGGIDEAVTAAEQMLAEGTLQDAGQTFAAILAEAPDNARAIAGLARTLLAMGRPEDAAAALDRAPESAASDPAIAAARAALELAAASAEAGETGELRARLDADPTDHQARFDLASALLAQGDNDAAVESLLELFRRDREWNEGAAKTQLLKIFESLGPADPLVAKGRRRLSSMIFS